MSRWWGSTSPEVSMVAPRCFCEGEERLGGFLGDEGQVDVFSDEGPLVGAAEQEQRFGEVDRSGVDEVEAVDELVVVAALIVAGHVEQRLRDRQRGAQLVGGVGGEPLLFGDVCFEPREHGVEGVGELAELVVAALQPDPVGERSGRGHARGVGDAGQRARASGRRGATLPGDRTPAGTPASMAAFGTKRVQEVGAVRAGATGRAVDHDRRVRSAAGTPTRRRAARRRRP